MIRVPSSPSSTAEKRTAFYWGAFVFVLVLYHLSIVSTFGDDVGFATRLDHYPSLLDYLSMRYSAWSSRLVCDAASVILTRHVLLWKTANIAVYLLLAYALHRLSGKSKSSLFVVLALLLIFRTRDLSSAGWIATNVFYLWPAAFGLFSLIIPYKLAEGERVRWPEVALCVPATVIGANTEQWVVIQIAMLTQFLGIAISRRYTKKAQCTGIFAGLYVILFACLATILLSPGNYIRAAKEVVVHMKDFYEKNLLDQVIDGFERTMSLLLSSNNAVFFVFAVIIFACVAKKNEGRAVSRHGKHSARCDRGDLHRQNRRERLLRHVRQGDHVQPRRRGRHMVSTVILSADRTLHPGSGKRRRGVLHHFRRHDQSCCRRRRFHHCHRVWNDNGTFADVVRVKRSNARTVLRPADTFGCLRDRARQRRILGEGATLREVRFGRAVRAGRHEQHLFHLSLRARQRYGRRKNKRFSV